MEKALRSELALLFPGTDIWPATAPLHKKPPFVVYQRDYTVWKKTLDGFTGREEIGFVINVFGKDHDEMQAMRSKAEGLVRGMLGARIGEGEAAVEVRDVDLNGVAEIFEPKLSLYRGVVDFTAHI